MLRLVHPAPATDQEPPTRRRGSWSPALSLTDAEARHLRAALRNIARSYGGLAALARALNVSPDSLWRKGRLSPGLAVALWRLTRIPVETLLCGTLAAVPTPPTPPASSGGAA